MNEKKLEIVAKLIDAIRLVLEEKDCVTFSASSVKLDKDGNEIVS